MGAADGDVGEVGIGSKSTATLLAAVRTGVLDVALVAGRYTLLEQPAAARLLPACLEHGVDVLAAGVFNSGLLATAYPAAGARYEYGAASADTLAAARALAARCLAFGVELPVAALQFPLRHPAVRAVVLGAASPEQLRENVERMRRPVPDALWAEVGA